MALEANLKTLVAMANKQERLGRKRTGFKKKRFFRVSNACWQEEDQSQECDCFMRSIRGHIIEE
jgi:hypothetical protein